MRSAHEERVNPDRDKDHQTVDALQPQRIDPHQRQPVLDDQQRERAQHDAQQRARPAPDRHPADDSRSDDRQFKPQRYTGIHSRIARGPKRPAEAAQ